MNLPHLHYACTHCGYSCQGLAVELDSAEFQALRTHDASSVQTAEGRHWLSKSACGSCHFLLSEQGGRCELHRRFGPQAKPTPCREFPFRALATPDGVFVGASFACEAIASGHGPVLSEPPEVRVLQLPAPLMAPGVEFDLKRYRRWEARVGELMQSNGSMGLWSAAIELSLELLELPPRAPSPGLDHELQAVFRGLLALAEGYRERQPLLNFLQAHAEQGSYDSQLLGGRVDVAEILSRWEEPWSLWPEVAPFFEHLLFRKYLLEGPDVHSRICSLPILAQLLQFLAISRAAQGGSDPVRFALRRLEERLTFHARGLEGYLGRCGEAFLVGFSG